MAIYLASSVDQSELFKCGGRISMKQFYKGMTGYQGGRHLHVQQQRLKV